MNDIQDVHIRTWDGEGCFAGKVFFDMRDETSKRALLLGCEDSVAGCLEKCHEWAQRHGYTSITDVGMPPARAISA
jgi:hypothetical protein